MTAWYAASCHGIIDPCVFENAGGNAHRYKVPLEPFLRSELNSRQLDVLVSTGRSNYPHSTDFHVSPQDSFLRRTHFSFWVTTWPARSPGRAVQGYFLWGYVKSKAYQTRPANIDDLKQ